MPKPITKKQIKALQDQNRVVKLIDIRPAAEYEKQHVPGSLNIPAETIVENIPKFSAKDTIVCICTKGLERSQNAAEAIAGSGFENVFYLEKGSVGWHDE